MVRWSVLMQRLYVLLILFLSFSAVVFPQTYSTDSSTSSDDDSQTVEEKTGGQFPAEVQGADSNEINPNRQALGNFPKPPNPEFTKDLVASSQSQNETKPGYYVLEGYVDISYRGLRLQADH